jgi:hypothetical protein
MSFLKIDLKIKLSIFRFWTARQVSRDPQISAARRDRLVYFWTFFNP